MGNKNKKGSAATQEVAAPAAQTVATATPSTSTVSTATVAKKITIVTRKVPKKRTPAAAKAAKVAKRLTGDLVFIATVSYNHWRSFVANLLNTTHADGSVHTAAITPEMVEAGDIVELETPVAAFRPDETVLTHKTKEGEEVNTIWAGYIAVKPENVAKVTAQLNAITETNLALPVVEQDIELWTLLETPVNVAAKPRAPRKPKATAATTETGTTETTSVETVETTEEVVA